MDSHSCFNPAATVPSFRHPLVEPDVDRLEPRSGEDGGSLVRDAAGFDDDPYDLVGHDHEGVDETSEMEGLKRPYVGRSDGDYGFGVLDRELALLLDLHRLYEAVRRHDLCRVGVRPRPDEDVMAADEGAADLPVGGMGRGLGVSDLGGGAEHGSRGEEEEEEDAGEAEAPDEADEAAEAVEDEPKNGARRFEIEI